MKNSKEGKTSWKVRKEAMDEVDQILRESAGLIDTSPQKLKGVIEILRALRDRLSDTQINLKPVAARIIGSLLAVSEAKDQAKLGKIVYAPLIACAMSDIKKLMRDAALEGLRQGTSLSQFDGDGVNQMSMEGFVTALVSEVNEKSSRVSKFFVSSCAAFYFVSSSFAGDRASRRSRFNR
jgi:hypothetical protein